MTDAPRVFVLGPGRAGRSLAVALAATGVPIVGVHGRERPFPRALADAEVVLVATPDAAVGGVFLELAAARFATDVVVLQLSGARAPDDADAILRARGHGVGTFHPLVPLADAAFGADRLRGAWVGLGGDERAVAVGAALAAILGAHVLAIPDAPIERARYHAAAVFASNFPVVLAAVAEHVFARAGVEVRGARDAVRHLLASAAANVSAVDDPAAALTGPVARGDAATVERHLAALATDASVDALYRALARATVDLARRPGANLPSLDAIIALLE